MPNESRPPYRHILVALDGSADSRAGAALALDIAAACGATVRAVHAYDAKIHNSRFREMEPGLPPRFRSGEALGRLRREHDTLMGDGFRALSFGYTEELLRQAGERGVAATTTAVAGRNYCAILDLLRQEGFDLAVLGATGLGAQEDGLLGSTVLRVLRACPCDLLVARDRAPRSRSGGITACIDGSRHAAQAADLAAALAARLSRPLDLFAAYDVAFHRTIFQTMARGLSAERLQATGLDRQEQVHEELIDKSLEALYGSYLQDAARAAAETLPPAATTLRPGKAYRAIVGHAAATGSSLLVLGRYGHNREEIADIGAHAEAVVRLAPCHVLVRGGAQAATPSAADQEHARPAGDLPEAEEIVLASLRPKAPPFHKFMARKKLVGSAWQVGDRVIIYEIATTTPAGRVRATDRTVVRFTDS